MLWIFNRKQKPVKKMFKIDYLTCAHDDGGKIFFKKSFVEYRHVEAYDWLEALAKFNRDKKEFFAIGNIYVMSVKEIDPVK